MNHMKRIIATAAALAREAIGLAGVGLISAGAHDIYPPLGFIVLGCFLIYFAVILSGGE